MADVSKVNVNSTDYNIKDSNAMHKGVDRVTAGQLSGSTLGTRATAEGYDITASGLNSHGEGSGTTAEGENSHAEGNWTFATGFASHTEGEGTYATQSYSHAEGYHSTASKNSSHAEGYYSTASGLYSHVEGSFGTASGSCSHAEGYNNVASGNYSHAEGYQTKASSAYQHVEGKYNVEDANDTYAHIIGGGTSNNARKNIFTVDWNGVARDGTENRLLPFKAVSEAEYAALSQAEKTNGTAYFRYEANGIMREIQDNGSATSLTSGALPTGQTITSYLNSHLTDFIKPKRVWIDNSDLSQQFNLTAYVNLDPGYKFLCWLPTGASDGWVSSFPIYISNTVSTCGFVFWNGDLPIATNRRVIFTYLEIKY